MNRPEQEGRVPAPASPARGRIGGRPTAVLPSGARAGLDAAGLRLVWRALLFDGASVPSWHENAACAGRSALFLTEVDGGRLGVDAVRAAKRVCARCPVRRACLDDVMAHESHVHRHGVVGGLSAGERRRLYRKREGAASWAG
jgi:WhiB family redox-sensing transcriptional regulator